MTEPNAFMVKLRSNLLENVLEIFSSLKSPLSEVSYRLYVPERFVLGNFRITEHGFKLSNGGIFYEDSEEELKRFEQYIDNETLDVVNTLEIPDYVLKSVTEQCESYVNARKQIHADANSIENYLLDWSGP